MSIGKLVFGMLLGVGLTSCSSIDEIPSASSLLDQMVKNPASRRAEHSPFFEALTELLRRDAKSEQDTLGWAQTPQYFYLGEARQVRVGDETFFLAVLYCDAFSIPGDSALRFLLIEERGHLLDIVDCSCSTRMGILSYEFLSSRRYDECSIRVNWTPGYRNSTDALKQFSITERGTSNIVTRDSANWPIDWELNGLCKISINSQRLHVTFPLQDKR